MVSEHASPLATLGGVDAGGQNVHVAALSQALAARGHEVVVHTRRDDPDVPRRVELSPGVVVDHVPAGPARVLGKDDLLPHVQDLADDLHRTWGRRRPDVVHGHFWMSGIASLAAARPLGVPVAQTFHALGVVKRRHQGDKDTSPPERLHLERHVVQEADHLVATCSDEVFELLRLGADRTRTSVVPCGVDPRLFNPRGPVAPRDPDRPRVLFLGRLVERKGIGNVISALAEGPLADLGGAAGPAPELVVAGGPPAAGLEAHDEVRRLRDLAREVGVADQVRFVGRVDREDLPALLRSADVVACVPWYEPFGIVPLEAMACGVPVVASAVGGLVDTVVDGLTGVHVPPRDPPAVARALRRLLEDPEARREMGAAGARRVRARYTWGRVAAATEAVYDDLLGAAAPTRAARVGGGALSLLDQVRT